MAMHIDKESSDPSPNGDSERPSSAELNAWKRGFTPQAEIWNGRMAMLGVVIGISVFLIFKNLILN